jgi:cytochrome P450
MDPSEHGTMRLLASAWFTPRAIARRRPEVERLAAELIDGLAERSSADFVADLAAPLTLSVLADMLGVPRADWQAMFHWTNQIAGSGDPEFQSVKGAAGATMRLAIDEMFAYLLELAQERRVTPRDDIVSVLANAKVDGRPLPDFELLSYLALLVVAGNETTRNAASGGLLALIERHDERAKLRADPALVNSAVEETVRFTSPVIQFCRTPVADFELQGQTIRAGESLCLFYPSANRDESVFDEPDQFRIARHPNPHIGFGIGEHFCLGANLARLELRVIFEQLIPRLRDVGLAAPPERMRSSFLGGVKRMPLEYQLESPAARRS